MANCRYIADPESRYEITLTTLTVSVVVVVVFFYLTHGLHRLFESWFFLFGLKQLLLPFVQVSLELTHQLIAIGLRDLLHQTQLIRVPLFQLPILRKEEKKPSHDFI